MMGPGNVSILTRGSACSNSRPPPLQTPKVFEPIFLQIEILGKMGGAAGAKEFFPGIRYVTTLFNPPMCVYSKCSDGIGDFKSAAKFA